MTTRVLWGGIVFLAAFLLFLIEPIAAKQLLPIFGGSAAVWITCLVFFQSALLAGYAYAHWAARRPQLRWQMFVHLALLLLALVSAGLWIAHAGTTRWAAYGAAAHPVSMIFVVLLGSIGLPFLLLAATSPLLQAWWARLKREPVPYRLFALSNFASLLALAAYPVLIEPHLTLRMQRLLWTCALFCFTGLFALLTGRARGATAMPAVPTEDPKATPSPLGRRCLWLLLPMAAAMQLSAVTSYITANIAAIPLLWILPLGVYLLTLIIAFEYARWVPRAVLTRLMAILLAALGYMLAKVDVSLPASVGIAFFLAELFFACLFCHVEAYALRPKSAKESTVFYMLFAAGGALGSFLVGIVSPLVFAANYDVALAFVVTALVALATAWKENWSRRLVWGALSAMLLYLLVMLHIAYRRDTLFATRNFYASLRVKQSLDHEQRVMRTLTNGTIQHGTQIFAPELARIPTSYYAEDSGIGLALTHCCSGRPRRVGVVGLGAGTIATYGRAGDVLRFYEINPAVRPIAEHFFTYLRDSTAQISFVEGDARASLTAEAPQHFDVLAIDAFSGDAIPLHLLTREAMEVYRRHLAPGGVLAFHVSNQHVDLEPVIALLAQSSGMQARTVVSLANESRGEFNATWVLVTNNRALLALPEIAEPSWPSERRPGLRLWTDNYSSLLPLLR